MKNKTISDFSKLSAVKSVAAFVFLSSNALTAEINYVSLSSMSLEELLDIKISVASRNYESVDFAPGNVSVYSHQEIEAFGARNLRDVLDRMTSMGVVTSHVFPQHKISMRGVNTGSNDVNILVLINGNPFRNANTGGSNSALYSGFPVSVIDHIEVIRGPGSVLYGSNAFAGVINIVTKTQLSSLPASNISVTLGSFSKKSLEMASQFTGENYDILLGLNTQKSDGDEFENITDQFGNIGEYSSGLDQMTAIASGAIGQFSFTAFYTDFKADNGGGLFKLREQSYYDEKRYVAVGYQHEISGNWTVAVSYLYSDQILEWDINNPRESRQTLDSVENIAEVTLRGVVMQDVDIVLGSSRSIYKGEFVSSIKPHEIWRQSYFGQVSTMVTPTLNVIMGFQWNRPEESEGDLSSRYGIVKQLGDSWWLKLSYGEAFRAPFGTELFVNSPGLSGNIDLIPEQIRTYEGQLSYVDATKQLSVSVYRSDQEDTINQVVVPQKPSSFANQGEVEYQGVELEAKYSAKSGIVFTFNANYQTSETEAGIKDDSFAPNLMVKAGVYYEYGDKLSIAFFNRYLAASTDLNETRHIPTINPIPDSYNLLTAKVTWDVSRYIQPRSTGRSSIALYLDNILDEEIFSPDFHNFGETNSIPSHDGFNVHLSFQYAF